MIDFLKYNWSNKNYLERLRSADTKRKCFCVHSQGFIDSMIARMYKLKLKQIMNHFTYACSLCACSPAIRQISGRRQPKDPTSAALRAKP